MLSIFRINNFNKSSFWVTLIFGICSYLSVSLLTTACSIPPFGVTVLLHTVCQPAGSREWWEWWGDSDCASLFIFMRCWGATLLRLTRCRTMSAEVDQRQRHQNIVVGPSCEWQPKVCVRVCVCMCVMTHSCIAVVCSRWYILPTSHYKCEGLERC